MLFPRFPTAQRGSDVGAGVASPNERCAFARQRQFTSEEEPAFTCCGSLR